MSFLSNSIELWNPQICSWSEVNTVLYRDCALKLCSWLQPGHRNWGKWKSNVTLVKVPRFHHQKMGHMEYILPESLQNSKIKSVLKVTHFMVICDGSYRKPINHATGGQTSLKGSKSNHLFQSVFKCYFTVNKISFKNCTRKELETEMRNKVSHLSRSGIF